MTTCSSLFPLVWFLTAGTPTESYLGVHVAQPLFEDPFAEEPETAIPLSRGGGLGPGGGEPDLAAGLEVTRVVENSPAAQAGLQAGDHLLRLDGTEPRTAQHLDALVARTAVGSTVQIELRRGEQILEVRTTTVPRLLPRGHSLSRGGGPPPGRHIEPRRFGLALSGVTADEARAAGVAPGDGVRVHRLFKHAVARDKLRPGDVILRVGKETVHGPEDFVRLARSLEPGAEVELLVARGTKRDTIVVNVLTPDHYVSSFHFPGLVIYEHDPREDETVFGVILNIFKYSRIENQSTYRFLWFIKLRFGTNETLEEVAP